MLGPKLLLNVDVSGSGCYSKLKSSSTSLLLRTSRLHYVTGAFEQRVFGCIAATDLHSCCKTVAATVLLCTISSTAKVVYPAGFRHLLDFFVNYSDMNGLDFIFGAIFVLRFSVVTFAAAQRAKVLWRSASRCHALCVAA